MAKVVAHYLDGRVLKGSTDNFALARDVFHMRLAGVPPDTTGTPIDTGDLKAVFFVNDWDGHPEHVDRRAFDHSNPMFGTKLQVVFQDFETLVGSTVQYERGRPFCITPADPASNNVRCCVFPHAVRSVSQVTA
jgi:hypothetical protein